MLIFKCSLTTASSSSYSNFTNLLFCFSSLFVFSYIQLCYQVVTCIRLSSIRLSRIIIMSPLFPKSPVLIETCYLSGGSTLRDVLGITENVIVPSLTQNVDTHLTHVPNPGNKENLHLSKPQIWDGKEKDVRRIGRISYIEKSLEKESGRSSLEVNVYR